MRHGLQQTSLPYRGCQIEDPLPSGNVAALSVRAWRAGVVGSLVRVRPADRGAGRGRSSLGRVVPA